MRQVLHAVGVVGGTAGKTAFLAFVSETPLNLGPGSSSLSESELFCSQGLIRVCGISWQPSVVRVLKSKSLLLESEGSEDPFPFLLGNSGPLCASCLRVLRFLSRTLVRDVVIFIGLRVLHVLRGVGLRSFSLTAVTPASTLYSVGVFINFCFFLSFFGRPRVGSSIISTDPVPSGCWVVNASVRPFEYSSSRTSILFLRSIKCKRICFAMVLSSTFRLLTPASTAL
jgi:hypothetical protein